ncbi:MAG: TetR family transcriptional regulator [Eubacterium sp.]
MPRKSAELKENRREEIIDACEKLYRSMNYQDITIKEISTETSFSRPSIYNYFETKEEIFLALLVREYQLWSSDLLALSQSEEKLSADEFAEGFSRILEKRVMLLKITSMNLYEIEEHSRLERLIEYKKEFLRAMEMVKRCLQRFFPEMTEQQMEDFRYAFFPFMYGIYPYVYPTAKQMQAMDTVGISVRKTTIGEMTYHFMTHFIH